MKRLREEGDSGDPSLARAAHLLHAVGGFRSSEAARRRVRRAIEEADDGQAAPGRRVGWAALAFVSLAATSFAVAAVARHYWSASLGALPEPNRSLPPPRVSALPTGSDRVAPAVVASARDAPQLFAATNPRQSLIPRSVPISPRAKATSDPVTVERTGGGTLIAGRQEGAAPMTPAAPAAPPSEGALPAGGSTTRVEPAKQSPSMIGAAEGGPAEAPSRAVAATAPVPESRALEHPPVQDADGDELVFKAMRALRDERAPERAARLLDRYLGRFPLGALREEALTLRVEAAVAVDDPNARRFAKQYLETFPNGGFRLAAESVMSQPPRQ